MFNNENLNRSTPFDKLNSISKIILLLIVIIISIISKTILDIIITITYIVTLLLISKVPLKTYINSIASIKILIIFIFIINIIFQIPLFITILLIYKIVIVILVSTLLINTTPPTEITYALEKILTPFNKIIKTKEIALIIALSLRFIPSIKEESQRIIKAISLRGIDFNGSIKNKITAISILIPPMFASSIQKSDSISDIMEVRLYNYNNYRTNYRMNKYTYKDTILIISSLIIIILLILF